MNITAQRVTVNCKPCRKLIIQNDSRNIAIDLSVCSGMVVFGIRDLEKTVPEYFGGFLWETEPLSEKSHTRRQASY